MASQEDNSFLISNAVSSAHFMALTTAKPYGALHVDTAHPTTANGSAPHSSSSFTPSTFKAKQPQASPVFQPTQFGMGRSGSLPPFVAKPYKPLVIGTDYEQSEIEDETNKENFSNADNQMAYYRGAERQTKQSFKPIDGSNGEAKRSITPVSVFDSTDDDALAGELTENTDTENRFRYKQSMPERERQGLAIKLPGLGEMSFQC